MSFIDISGVFADPAGEPLPGVEITITSLRVTGQTFGNLNITQITGAGGDYAFSLYPGLYRVIAKYPGVAAKISLGEMVLESGSEPGSLNDYVQFSAPALATPTIYADIKSWWLQTKSLSIDACGQAAQAKAAAQDSSDHAAASESAKTVAQDAQQGATQQSVIARQAASDAVIERQTAAVYRKDAQAFAEVAQSGIAVTSKDVYPNIAAGLVATEVGRYFQVPQGTGAERAFITYLNQDGTAVEAADWPGMGAVKNLVPLNATTKYSSLAQGGEYEFAEQFSDLTLDSQGNIISYVLGDKRSHLIPTEFKTLYVDGEQIDPRGTLPGDDRDNLLTLSETSVFSSGGDEYEFNPKKYVILDSEQNVLFDLDELLEKLPQWDEAYQKSLIVAPQKDNPLTPFAVNDSSGKSQIRAFNTETMEEVAVTSGSSNETQPKAEALDRIVWQSDRAQSAPGGLFYAALPDLKEHAYIARPHIAGWGHSFMENGVFMRKLSELTGLYSYNFGKGATTSVSIAARQGGRRISYAPVGGVIPASAAVNLTPNTPGPASNAGGLSLSFRSNLAGVAGVFSWDGSMAKFTRDTAGDEVSVSEAVPLYVLPVTTNSVTNGAAAGVQYDLHDECINVFWLGRNNIASTDTIIECAVAMVEYIKNIGKRIVICPDFPSAGETTGTDGYNQVLALNTHLKSLYPAFYCEIDGIDLLQNFKNHHNPDFANDVTAVQHGSTPPTLRYDALHPAQSITSNNPSLFPDKALYIGAEVNAEFVYQFIKHKGWI